eukprot:26366-Chlamydomonas_euryale.AAC.1
MCVGRGARAAFVGSAGAGVVRADDGGAYLDCAPVLLSRRHRCMLNLQRCRGSVRSQMAFALGCVGTCAHFLGT